MKRAFKCIIIMFSMLSVLATAEDEVRSADDGSAGQLLMDRLAAQQPNDVEGMAAWRADVLNKVLSVWRRPSQTADAATWVMRVKTDSHGRLLNLSWITRTGDRSLDRSIVRAFKRADPYPAPPDERSAAMGVSFTDEATALRHAEDQLAVQAERNAETEAKINEAGPLRAYLALVSHIYKKCENIANDWLIAFFKRLDIISVGFPIIERCVREEGEALSDEVRFALQVAPEELSDPIKGLHAYTVASLRALTNFHQSVMEARQARAERSTGIDERSTRILLDL